MKRTLAVVMATLQILLLLPMAALAAPAKSAETPVLNETIVGTMQYGTFSFASGGTAPDGETAWEGSDYAKPFVYSDDYFAAPSYEAAPAAKRLTWKALPNPALVSASADLALAAFGSNEETDNYPNYDKCAREYLQKCGFTQIAVNEDFEHENAYNALPTKDSVGVVIGQKDITVWDAAQGKNRTCRLIAVGVRGGGYGAEWASNVTLGEAGRHAGFDESAQKILSTLRSYLRENGISKADDVKYWIAGFSRGAAIANLAAGDITSAPETYFAEKRDIYAYTFECPAAAMLDEDPDGTVFPNIHNILNRMDPVPRVSLPEFGNCRLGVEYTVPDHTTTDRMDDYYGRMYQLLKTLATGYGADPDPVLTSADPAVFPYNKKLPIYNFSLAALVSNPSELGLEVYHDWQGTPIGDKTDDGYALYADEFLDIFVAAFGASKAWDYDPSSPNAAIENTDPPTHRKNFAANGYQEAIRTLVGAALARPGAALKDMFGNVTGAIPSILIPAARMVVNLKANYDVFHTERAAAAIANDVETILHAILQSSGFFEDQPDALRDAAHTLAPAVTRLFLYDRVSYGSQYLGTLLKYAGSTFITPHTSELVAAWNLSLDDNYTGDYRELTVPLGTEVTLYAFRPGLDDALSMDGTGAQIAQARAGAFTSRLDQRVTLTAEGDTQTVRWPAFLDIRAEVRMANGGSTDDLTFHLQELCPDETGATLTAELTRDQSSGNITAHSLRQTLENCDTAETAAINAMSDSTAYPMAGDAALLITAGRSTNAIEDPVTGSCDVAVRVGDVIAKRILMKEYSSEPTLNGANTAPERAAELTAAILARGDTTAVGGQTVCECVSIPASSVYYDDDFVTDAFTGAPDSAYSVQNQATVDSRAADGRILSKKLFFGFTGSRIDLYCTGRRDGGYLLASVRDESGNYVVRDGKRAIQIGSCRADALRYNAPTISFDGLTPGTNYVLELYAVEGANYTLDAVRVYNSANDAARFVRVRELLADGRAITCRPAGTQPAAQTDSAVRLSPGESLAFRVKPGCDVAVGLSAPENRGAGSVTATDGTAAAQLDITSVVDAYYPVSPAPDGTVVLHNSGACAVCVTNLRLTPVGADAAAGDAVQRAYDLRLAVSAFLGRPVAENPAPAPGETMLERMRGLLSQYAAALTHNVGILLKK